MKKYFFSVLTIFLLPFAMQKEHIHTVHGEEESSSLAMLLSNYDYNYKRSTAINWSASAYNEILESGLNAFPFTSTRVTLFIENALYMYSDVTDELINSGYYTPQRTPGKMRHYRIDGGKDERDVVAPLAKDSHSGNVNVNDYYVNLHTINANIATFAPLFTYDETRDLWSSKALKAHALTLKDLNNKEISVDLETAFMYFTAPTFTNPVLVGSDPYFTFGEVTIKYNASNDLILTLCVAESDADKVESDELIFSRATIDAVSVNATTIGAIMPYINS